MVSLTCSFLFDMRADMGFLDIYNKRGAPTHGRTQESTCHSSHWQAVLSSPPYRQVLQRGNYCPIHTEEPGEAQIGTHFLPTPHLSAWAPKWGWGRERNFLEHLLFTIIPGAHISYSFNPCRKLGNGDHLLHFSNRGTMPRLVAWRLQGSLPCLGAQDSAWGRWLHRVYSFGSVSLQSTWCPWPGSLGELSHLHTHSDCPPPPFFFVTKRIDRRPKCHMWNFIQIHFWFVGSFKLWTLLKNWPYGQGVVFLCPQPCAL